MNGNIPLAPSPHSNNLTLLKWGGSLITNKAHPNTARPQVLARLAQEISVALDQAPSQQLILGHGSGSFGHVAAKKHDTHQGVRTPQQWQGFVEVWRQAATLNRLVIEALHAAGLPAIAFPASASAVTRDGKVVTWDTRPITTALQVGLLPVVYGDVVLDETLGGAILSTEAIFKHITPQLHPQRILLAGLQSGVWADYPACTQLVPQITPQNIDELGPALGASAAVDVTGGMAAKVREMLALVEQHPTLNVLIFSGESPGAVQQALLGSLEGTRIVHG